MFFFYFLFTFWGGLRIIANSACYLLLVCPSVRLSACISASSTRRISVKFDTGDSYENLSRSPNLFKIGQKYRALRMRTLSTFCSCRLLEYLRRYKHYANAPKCYMTVTLSILLNVLLSFHSLSLPLYLHLVFLYLFFFFLSSILSFVPTSFPFAPEFCISTLYRFVSSSTFIFATFPTLQQQTGLLLNEAWNIDDKKY